MLWWRVCDGLNHWRIFVYLTVQPFRILNNDRDLPRYYAHRIFSTSISLQDVNRYDGNTKSQSLKDHVYDELIQSILFIVKKLNLKTVKEKSEVIFSDFLFCRMQLMYNYWFCIDFGKSWKYLASFDISLQESEKPEEKETSVTPSSDPLTGLVADVPKDFHIFINLVEFCR